ncbi:hypothetical protein SLA2020_121460 [Shorea laevis]
MSRATVELDFFGMEKENSSKSPSQQFLQRRRSFCDIQSAISKINPKLVKSVIASGSANRIDPKTSFSVPCTPTDLVPSFFPALPVLNPVSRTASEILPVPETAPLTIFYNGTVSIFNIPRDKAEGILKLAVEGSSKKVESTDSEVTVPSSDQQQLLESLNGDLPLARRKSLHRFLEKRKERLTSVMPYACFT